MPRRGKKGPSLPDSSTSDLVPDPTWVDIEPLQKGDVRFAVFDPPRAFYDDMVAKGSSWAMGADNTVVRCVASSLSRIAMPWLADLQQWRLHAADFFCRLCSHREHRMKRTDERLDALEKQVNTLATALDKANAEVKKLEVTLDATRDDLNRARGQLSQLTSGFAPVQELALLRPSSVITHTEERIRRAQYRAVSSRSPDPRAATAAMRRVEQMDRDAMAKHED